MKRVCCILLVVVLVVSLILPVSAAAGPDDFHLYFDAVYARVWSDYESKYASSYPYYSVFMGYHQGKYDIWLLAYSSSAPADRELIAVLYGQHGRAAIWDYTGTYHHYSNHIEIDSHYQLCIGVYGDGKPDRRGVGYYLPEYSNFAPYGVMDYPEYHFYFTPPVVVDASELEALLVQAAAIQDIGYTQASWSILQNSIQQARQLLAGTDYTQEQVDARSMLLRNAMASLVVTSTPPPTGDGRYLVNGLTVSDLMPFQIAALENMLFARNNGLLIFAALLGISLIPVILRHFFSRRGGRDPLDGQRGRM